MIRFLKYFLPVCIPFAGIVLLSYNPTERFFDEAETLTFLVFIHSVLLLSIYWAVGYWIPNETRKTAASVGFGIATLIIAGSIASLLAAILIPFAIFSLLLIKKRNA